MSEESTSEMISSVQSRGKVVLVTGASSGIGMAVARLMAKEGYQVMAHGRREERLRTLRSQGERLEWMAGDLTAESACEGLFEAALLRFGRIDCLVNCAGKNHVGKISEINIDSLCEMLRINTEVAFRLTYLALKHFESQGAGDLVHITSIMGHKVRETGGGYAGSKHAVEALCEALRMELARTDIRVACLAPGLVHTELHRDQLVHPSISRSIEPLSAEDVAQAVLWMLRVPRHMNVPQLVMLPKGHVI